MVTFKRVGEASVYVQETNGIQVRGHRGMGKGERKMGCVANERKLAGRDRSIIVSSTKGKVTSQLSRISLFGVRG